MKENTSTLIQNKGIQRVFTGTPREPIAGYCRAIKKWNYIVISWTTASDWSDIIGRWDPELQMIYIMQKIEQAIQLLWWSLDDIIKTRIYIRNQEDCEKIVRVHGKLFRWREPANTTIQADLIGDEFLVEVEAEALID